MPLQQTDAVAPGHLVTVAVVLLASLTLMANATISPALPGLRAHFADVDGIETLAGLLLTLPSASILLAAGVFGWLADRVDRQKLLIAATLLYAVGGTSGLWANTLPQLLAGRMVLGLGVAGSMTLAMAWGADLWHGAARARFLGIQGAAMSAGGIVVMLLGGALALLGWRGAFAVYALVLPVAGFALYALAPYAAALREGRVARAEARLTEAGNFPWAAYALIGGLAFVFMATFYIMPTRLPFLLEGLGVSNPMTLGLIMATMTLTSIPGSLAYGRIRRHLSAMSVYALSYGFMGLGLILISQADGVAMVVMGTLLAGAGMGPAMPNYTTHFMAFVAPSQRGRAAGLLTTAFFAGQFASPLVSAPLVAWFGPAGGFGAAGVALVTLSLVVMVSGIRHRVMANA